MDNQTETIPMFHIIHPSIIDLYIKSLTLYILQERLSRIRPDSITTDIQNEIDLAASEYVKSSKIAEDLFGSYENVKDQLDIFTYQRKGIA